VRFLFLGSLRLLGLSVVFIVLIMYTQFSLCEVHVTETQFHFFMAMGSLPQTLPCLVVTEDKGLVGTGLYLVISDACLYSVFNLKVDR